MASFDEMDTPVCGRKGKTCSMTGCQNTHLRCPNMSFFRFPKETSRSREWLKICQRPDLLARMDSNEININNYYVCEIHFPQQILDYATRKILIKTAKPLTLDELKAMPEHERLAKAAIPMRIPKRRQTINYGYDRGHFIDEAFENDDDRFANGLDQPEVIIPKIEAHYLNTSDLLEPIVSHDEDGYVDDGSKQWWTAEATRALMKLRMDRDGEFEQPNARKSQLWIEIAQDMRNAGYDFTVEKVSKKWHNMTITYQKNCDRRSGRINWEFYEEMDVFYRTKKTQDKPDEDSAQPEPKQRKICESVCPRKSRAESTESTEAETPNRVRIRITNGSEPDTGTSTRSMTREQRRKRHGDNDQPNERPTTPVELPNVAIDESWWKSYFERKLELEREKMLKEEERHKDRINFQKMALMLQERAEKLKVDAMNNLTNALLKLQDASRHL